MRKRSPKGKLLDRLDNLQFQVLKLKRGAKCEISGRIEGLGTFHILDKSTYPRLRYNEENLLLAVWLPYHYNWHHYGHNHPRNRRTKERIIELRGKDYEDRLLTLNILAPRMNAFQLNLIGEGLKQEYEKLRR